MADAHAPRRHPAQAEGPLDLETAAAELLEQAAGLAAGRSARTLTPGDGAVLKQTLLALKAGQRLQDHVAPGPTTLMGIVGRSVLRHEAGELTLAAGQWAPCPAAQHSVEAETDAVLLITVAPERQSNGGT